MRSLPGHARGTIAEREDVVIDHGLQRGTHFELAKPVHGQAVELAQHGWRLDARRPHGQIGAHRLAACRAHDARRDFRHRLADHQLHAKLLQQLGRGRRYAFLKSRENARPGLDQHDADIVARIELVQPIGGQHLRRIAQFRRQFDARRAAADNRDLDARLRRRRAGIRFDGFVRLMLGAHAGGDQALAEAFGLVNGIERE